MRIVVDSKLLALTSIVLFRRTQASLIFFNDLRLCSTMNGSPLLIPCSPTTTTTTTTRDLSDLSSPDYEYTKNTTTAYNKKTHESLWISYYLVRLRRSEPDLRRCEHFPRTPSPPENELVILAFLSSCTKITPIEDSVQQIEELFADLFFYNDDRGPYLPPLLTL